MSSFNETQLPEEIIESFYPDGISNVSLLGGGIINSTYLTADSAGNKAVTQRLHDIFPPIIMEDLAVISEHMRQSGFEAARIIPTKTGELYATDKTGKIWRTFNYIENDLAPTVYDTETLVAMGGLLARLHRSFRTLDYVPKFGIPHFHETEYYAALLEARIEQMPDAATQALGEKVLVAYQGVPALPSLGTQLIHSDPRTQNMLFRNGKPFTFVDLDTVMIGSPWTDIGDFLRALTHDAVTAKVPDPTLNLPYAIEGYRNMAGTDIDKTDFRLASIAAARLIALELGMRFMVDIVEDNYFEWDQSRFQSRQANHVSHVRHQLRVHESLLDAEARDS